MAFFLRQSLGMKKRGYTRETGVTLIELMISIVVLGVLVGIAIPSFIDLIERNRLSGAAQTAYAEFQRVRAEAIKRDENIYLYAEQGGNWCYAVADQSARSANCNCDGSGGVPVCSVGGVEYVTKSTDFPDITMTRTNTYLGFDPELGMTASSAAGNMTFSKSDMHLKVIFSMLGRVRICYRDDPGDVSVSGFEGCS